MERTKDIPLQEIDKGFFIELECSMCGHKETLVSMDLEELGEQIGESGWRVLISDEYGITGQWCGCDYLDD